ncbi:MAG: formate dehydrogenase accessory sulfurtransferase FdhD [Acidimicrobiales bacterium]|nr:formate dehydrogenase accessory sulfurtransferase FdhD [Acidimicrobiales bacterium]
MARGRTTKVLTTVVEGTRQTRRPDTLIVEEPLSIHLDGVLVTTTMRTPGDDFELASGFCFTEGLLGGAPVVSCRYCGTGSASVTEFNVVSVETGGRAPAPQPRLTTITAACGLCGSRFIDELSHRLHPLVGIEPFPLDVLATIPNQAVAHQALFRSTGAVHAAAAFDRDGQPVVVREDVGRHNAVDKVVGRLLLDGTLPARDFALYASGRASFEIVAKAWSAGFAAVVAVSAPTALAVETARRAGITLAGFARDDRLVVYSPDRH